MSLNSENNRFLMVADSLRVRYDRRRKERRAVGANEEKGPRKAVDENEGFLIPSK